MNKAEIEKEKIEKDNLVESVIKRNEEDMKRINLLIRSLDKLKSKETAGRIENILIDETLRLANLNTELKVYLDFYGKRENRK